MNCFNEMQRILLVFIAVFSVAVASCVPENGTIDSTDIKRNLLSFQHGSVDFALGVFRGLYNDSSNLFFSPFSVWLSLVTIYTGSRHQTATELANVLGIRDTDFSLIPATLDAFVDVCKECKDSRSVVRIANRIYFQKDLDLQLCDQSIQKIFYKTDFKSDPEEARASINDFIANETNGKIRELISPLSVGPLTQMIVANAVYFKGMWENKFNESMTRQLRFYPDRETTLVVPMMNTVGEYLYGVSDEMDCQALEIPYDGGSINMLILLPKHSFLGLDNLARTITPERLETLLNSMINHEVLLTIPKFKVEGNYELSTLLRKIGLRSLFDPRFCDLSGFTESARLSIDAVHHKSYIRVNEEGTEAAGATGSLLSRDSHRLGITRFYVDKPFLYFIRDSDSNSLLFAGTVKNPQYNEYA